MAVAVTQSTPFRLSPSPSETELLGKYFRAFGDPIRLQILESLAKDEASVSELVDILALPQPKVSNHLACLRWCGFVETRREHRKIYYRLADDRVAEMIKLARSLLLGNEDHVAACRTVEGRVC